MALLRKRKTVDADTNGDDDTPPIRSNLPAIARHVTIRAPNMGMVKIPIVGTSPLVVNQFSEKQKNAMREKQEEGSRARKGRKRAAKNFEDACNAARYVSEAGWDGMPAAAFRSAMIAACGVVGFKMTVARKSIFVVAEGRDARSGTDLVRIHGKWHMDVRPERNANGNMDLRSRPMWNDWKITVTIQYDADVFLPEDIANLMQRAGIQIGVCEGRHDSRKSNGCGWGCFTIPDMGHIKPS